MHQIFQALILLLLPGLLATPVNARQLVRIAAWNIADFHHVAGFEARENIGTRRYPADFNALRKYSVSIDADIIALQEIATEQAARLLYPADQYWLYMSSRYNKDKQLGAEPDIYTALAIRKGSGIRPLQQQDLHALQIAPPGNKPYARSTRKGTALLLDIAGERIWVMSVHLKSSCANVKKIDQSTQQSCQLLWQQTQLLKEWIDKRLAENSNFIIAGDFNRRFGQLKDKGRMWLRLNRSDQGNNQGNNQHNTLIKRFPTTGLRRCPTRKGKGVHPIDWFLVNADFAARFVADSYFEMRWSWADAKKHRNRLSDHCPIHIDFFSS